MDTPGFADGETKVVEYVAELNAKTAGVDINTIVIFQKAMNSRVDAQIKFLN